MTHDPSISPNVVSAAMDDQALLRSMPLMLRLGDLKGKCVFLSKGWTDFTGQSKQAGLGSGWLDCVHPEDRKIAGNFHGAEPLLVEYRLRRADGEYRWVMDSIQPRVDQMGVLEGVTSSLTDIHSRKLSEEASARDAERRRLALQTAQLGCWQMDPETMEISFDERYGAIVGIVGTDRVKFSAVLSRIPEEDRGKLELAIAEAIKSAESSHISIEHRIVFDDGTVRWVSVCGGSVFEGEGGRRASVAGTVADITGRKASEESRRQNFETFATLIEKCPLGIYTVDSQFRVANVSEGALPAFRNVQPVIGRDFEEVMHTLWPEEFASEAVRIFRHTLETGEPYLSPGLLEKRKDLDVVEAYEWQTNRVTLANGEYGVVCYYFDSTKLQEASLALREARSRLQSTLAASSVGTWEFDVVEDRIRIDLDRAEQLFGVRPEEAEGGKLEVYLRAIHQEDRARVRAAVKEALASGDRYEQEYRLVGSDGSARWIIARGRVERNEAGEPIRMPGMAVDVSAQRWVEHELASIRKQWKLALESAEMGAWSIDPGSNTLNGDERFSLLFTGQVEPISYEQAFAAIHPEDRVRIREAVAAATDPERAAPYNEEYRVLHPDGTMLWLQGKGKGNYEVSGGVKRLLSFDGTVSDITDRKQFETVLLEADRRKNEFIATLAHELRNPLGPIRTGLEVMRLAPDDRETVEEVRSIMETQTKQLVRLVDDLLDVSRITSGAFTLRKERVELAEIVGNAVDATRSILESASHEFSVRLPPVPVFVMADSARVTQIVSNLLTNAARYTPAGGRIALDVDVENGDALISVRDSGMGIAEDMVERIFEMFEQVDRSFEGSQGGLGIGLTLVKRLTEMHGGQVAVFSEGVGKGSEFVVRLPLAVEEPPVGTSNAEPTDFISVRRVVVVDDNKSGADMLSKVIQMMGHEVRTVYDGASALEATSEFRPHVVFLDLGMPLMDGYETARRLRKSHGSQGLLLVALTGWGQDSDRRRTKEAGFDHHLVKPAEPSALMKLFAESANKGSSSL